LGRTIKPKARPLVILAPMHPVLFVFDVTDTEGADLPHAIVQEIEDPFAVEGFISQLTWNRTFRICERLGVHVKIEALRAGLAGDVRPGGKAATHYVMRLNADHDQAMRFSTLAHELGHLFCGHLGSSPRDFWEPRATLCLSGMELEAEAVAYLVASRFGLHTASQKYLSLYLKPHAVLPEFSMEAILTAAGAVEDIARGKLPGKERARRRRETNQKTVR
jgi:Zn-dependent peptidase ImmA (M78 family)